MQEPAAWGALPAQQASVHIGPLLAMGKAMLPATRVSNRVTARTTLAALIALLTPDLDLPESGFCFTAVRIS
jgi:hypothetical protein